MNDRLYRSVDDRVVAGVCGGLAARLAVDPSLVRIAYVVVALLTGVFPLLILYVIMAAVIPEEPTGFAGVGRSPTPPGPGAVPGWTPPGGPAPTAAWPPQQDTTGTAWPPQPDATGAPPTDAAAAAWPAVGGAVEGAAGQDATIAGSAPPPGPPPDASAPPWPAAAPVPTWDPGAPRRRSADPVLAVVGGLALVALGVYFLVRDRLDIDWGVVWAAGIVAVGVVVVLAALRPRS